MTSGGLRTSVKAYINMQRVASLAADHEINEATNTHLALLVETTITASSNNSYGLCDATETMSGGLRTSVKGYLLAQRLTVASDPLLENEATTNNVTAPLDLPPDPVEEIIMDSTTYGLSICDGNIPCFPMFLNSAKNSDGLSLSTSITWLRTGLKWELRVPFPKSCEANQPPLVAEFISVNGQPLSPEELRILQSCPNPPKKLKPGNYWYDKICGLWGKEGQKPSEVISPRLCVGGHMKNNASNGSTQVFINGRQITKVELRVLQLVGVNCDGNPHFWVYEDGSYQEEGMNSVRGSIWGMAKTKLVCAVLSLPVPSKFPIPVIPDIIEQQTLEKILLIGCNGSGASSIFKQVKILYEPTPFSVDERQSIKFTIQKNVYGYLGILLEARERFEEECLAEFRRERSSSQSVSSCMIVTTAKPPYSIGQKLKVFADWLLKTVVSGYLENIFPAATREFAPVVEELWNDSAIQATYKRSSELGMLPSVATYFIKRAVDILKVNYEPTDQDILYAEGDTSSNGLACVDFSLPQSVDFYNCDTADQHDPLVRYQLIKVNAELGEISEWSLEMFGDVGIVIFCVSLSDYDQFSADANGTCSNKMLQSRSVFERIVAHPTFEQMNCLLLLNEFDLFEKKIAHVPLTRCGWFDDFNPAINDGLGHRAYEYVAVKFKRLYSSLTDKRLYVSLVEDFEPGNVREALKYSTEILKWEKVKGDWYFSLSDTDYTESD